MRIDAQTPPSPDAAERRRSIRYLHLTQGWLLPEFAGPAAKPTEVRVFDVSRHGVGFRCEQKLGVGSSYRIRIGTGPLHLGGLIRIVNARPCPDGGSHYGGEFC